MSKLPKPFASSHTEVLLALAYSSPWAALPATLTSDIERIRTMYSASIAYYGDANRDVRVLVAVALSMPEDQVVWTVMRAVGEKLRADVVAQYENAMARYGIDQRAVKVEYDAKIARLQELESAFLAAYDPELNKRIAKPPQWTPPAAIGTGRPLAKTEINKQQQS